MRLGGAVAVVLATALSATGAAAQGSGLLPGAPGTARTVRLFDLLCMTHVPNLETIAGIASETFEEITGEALERYRPADEPEELRAWRFSEFGEDYVLVTARSAPNEAFAAAEPDFARATSYDCTLVLPDGTPQGEIRAELTSLMAREPDDILEAGPVRAVRWNGRTPEMLVNVLHYGSASGEPGGGLKTVAFVLPAPSSGKSDAQ